MLVIAIAIEQERLIHGEPAGQEHVPEEDHIARDVREDRIATIRPLLSWLPTYADDPVPPVTVAEPG